MTPADTSDDTAGPMQPGAAAPAPARTPARATVGFMLRHPARWVALGFGSGLSPLAPGTVGTLWAWISFLALDPWVGALGWGWFILGGTLIGWWACTRTAADLGLADPGAIVWDEVIAFWLVLWMVTPAGLGMQAIAFGLFRYFDAAKPGPVGWADRCLEHRRSVWARGAGILWDDLMAAACTLVVLAVGVALWDAWH